MWLGLVPVHSGCCVTKLLVILTAIVLNVSGNRGVILPAQAVLAPCDENPGTVADHLEALGAVDLGQRGQRVYPPITQHKHEGHHGFLFAAWTDLWKG